jgi:hypothetical protein
LDLGLAVAGLSAPKVPDDVRTLAASGAAQAVLSLRAAQLQTLWLIITGAQAEYAQVQAAVDHDAERQLLRALSMLIAVSEDETEAVHAALQAQAN